MPSPKTKITTPDLTQCTERNFISLIGRIETNVYSMYHQFYNDSEYGNDRLHTLLNKTIILRAYIDRLTITDKTPPELKNLQIENDTDIGISKYPAYTAFCCRSSMEIGLFEFVTKGLSEIIESYNRLILLYNISPIPTSNILHDTPQQHNQNQLFPAVTAPTLLATVSSSTDDDKPKLSK